jgi:hypothetical protein
MGLRAVLGADATPDALNEEFARRARATSNEAALETLSRGYPITYREKDTPPGHVIRKHPDGRTELVKVELRRKSSHKQ